MKKVCGTCKLWQPHLPRKPDLGGCCMWKSTEVWPASVVNVPGVRGAIEAAIAAGEVTIPEIVQVFCNELVAACTERS